MFRLRAALASRLRLHLLQAMSRKQLDKFLRLLTAPPSGAVFNPWSEVDRENDIGRIAPIIRRQQLRAYVQERLGRTKLVVIGEAPRKNEPPACRYSKSSSICFHAMKLLHLVTSQRHSLRNWMPTFTASATPHPAEPDSFASKSRTS